MWNVDPPCKEVHVISTHFETEPNADIVHVNEETYSGSANIDQIVRSTPFDIAFESDYGQTKSGFTLTWQCTGEYHHPIQKMQLECFRHV